MKRTLLITNTLYYFTLLAFACLAFGFLWQRVFYSIGLLFIGVQFLMVADSKKAVFTNPYFLISLSLPLCNLLRDGLSNIFLINLTLPLFVAFYIANKYKEDWVKDGFLVSTLIYLVTAIHSTFLYFSDIEATLGKYKIAQVVGVGAFNDHIRFSIVLSLSLAVLVYYYRRGMLTTIQQNYAKVYFLFVLFFIHLLAARTGLVVLYLMMILYLMMSSWQSKKYWQIGVVILLPLMFTVAYKTLPSFYYRLGYTLYDYQYYKDNVYREGSSDGIRYYSMQSGWEIFTQNLLWGVGFADLKGETNKWYIEKFPQMKMEEMMLPHSQYLVYAAAAGLLGLGLIALLYIYPLLQWKKISIEGRTIVLSLAIVSLVDVFLDSQLKIYVLGFFLPLALYHMPFRNSIYK